MALVQYRYSIVFCLATLLTACGGGGESRSDSESVGDIEQVVTEPLADTTERGWVEITDRGHDINLLESNGFFYTGDYRTQNGVDWFPVETPGTRARGSGYIDENGVHYLERPQEGYLRSSLMGDNWTYDGLILAETRRYAGTSDFLISHEVDVVRVTGGDQIPKLEFMINAPFGFREEFVTAAGDPIYTGRTGPIADNKNGVMVVADFASGVWRSDDFGRTWNRQLGDAGLVDLTLVSPSDPSKVYVIGLTFGFKSIDAGATWQPMEIPDYEVEFRGRDESIFQAGAIDGDNGDIVLYATSPIERPPAFFISSDDGNTWELFPYQLPLERDRRLKMNLYINEYGYFFANRGLYFLEK